MSLKVGSKESKAGPEFQSTSTFCQFPCFLRMGTGCEGFLLLTSPTYAPGGTKITGLGSHTFVSSPRDSTRIVDSGRISNLQIINFDLINLCILFIFFNFHGDFG
jgi:hypothetical protein